MHIQTRLGPAYGVARINLAGVATFGKADRN